MEADRRWMLVAAVAPIAWGSNYYVTRQFLPAGHPLNGAALRALPAGVLLAAVTRTRPRGSWWWRSAVLGVLNVGAFFVLIYVAAQRLPSSLAATVMALSATVMMLVARVVLAERLAARALLGGAVGFGGVCLMLLGDVGGVDVLGVCASVAAMLMSSVGYVLTKKWGRDVHLLALTSWQLIAGGLLLAPVAVVVEGAPPHLDRDALLGFAYVTLVATALAFTAWFAALRHLDAGAVGLVGLLNPVTGVVLGTVAAGEPFGARQFGGVVLVLAGVLTGQRRRPAVTPTRAATPDPVVVV